MDTPTLSRAIASARALAYRAALYQAAVRDRFSPLESIERATEAADAAELAVRRTAGALA